MKNAPPHEQRPRLSVLVSALCWPLGSADSAIALQDCAAEARTHVTEQNNIVPERQLINRNTRLFEVIAQLFNLCTLARAIDSRKSDQYRFQRFISRKRSSA